MVEDADSIGQRLAELDRLIGACDQEWRAAVGRWPKVRQWFEEQACKAKYDGTSPAALHAALDAYRFRVLAVDAIVGPLDPEELLRKVS